ncbi:TRAPP subunit, partial [Rhizoclosmatium sp. JEL0117]
MYLVIVGTRDNPLYELEVYTTQQKQQQQRDAQGEQKHLNQFIAHSALDIVDESMWGTKEMYLKVVDRFNDHHVSSYITPSGAKFMLVHDAQPGDVRSFFVDLHELYIKVLLNPFTEINGVITSQQFDTKVKGIARR